MNIIDAYKLYWRNFANFDGRASRPEFWWASLANLIAVAILIALTAVVHPLIFLYLIYLLASIIPSISIAVRRLHDTDHQGGWWLIGFIPLVGTIWLLVLYCTPSTPGANRFG